MIFTGFGCCPVGVLGLSLLVHCLLLQCSTKCPFLLCNHFTEEKRAGFFILMCSCCRVAVHVLCVFLALPWVGLWYMVVKRLHVRTGQCGRSQLTDHIRIRPKYLYKEFEMLLIYKVDKSYFLNCVLV